CCDRRPASAPWSTSSSPAALSRCGKPNEGEKALLPAALLIHRNHDDHLSPSFLGPEDHPWLEVLRVERSKMEGRSERDWDERLRDPLPCEAPAAKLKLAVHGLARLSRGKVRLPVIPRRVRAALFTEAVRDPELAATRAAATLG